MSVFQKRYNQLNRQQKRAANIIDGPVLVIAGPGSGKTELLSVRAANILRKTDTLPNNILCLTFTESAAANMRRRLAELIGQNAHRVAIHTFHGFGTEIINHYREFFYDAALFSPADEITQLEIFEEIFDKLAHDNPLRKTHPELGYPYLKSAKSAVELLKKAGLMPDEFIAIIECNEKALESAADRVNRVFGGRLNRESFVQINRLADWMIGPSTHSARSGYFKPLLPAIGYSLKQALQEAEIINKTAPLSIWKSKMTYRAGDRRVLKDARYIGHMRALADIYRQYRKEMHKRGYFDFQDMLLDVICELRQNETLLAELQEEYQYILVDEFQDTNDAQMRLLSLLADNKVNEGRPNIMAVGDDDQAIFKFQGAEISNILDFKERYRDVEVVVLKNNYRSKQDVLDTARNIIVQGSNRLENRIKSVEKKMVASRSGRGRIACRSFRTREHEYRWLAREIRKMLDKKAKPDEIAVIARKHENLIGLVPYLHKLNISVCYERRQNVLREPHIRQLIQIARFVSFLYSRGRKTADELLPEILSYPFWGIKRKTIWEISRAVFRKRASWLDCMLEKKETKHIAEFLLELAQKAQSEPLEHVTDAIIGSPGPGEFVSPYREYYFSKKELDENKEKYLKFLSALRVFTQALREYERGKILKISDMVAFVDLHEANGIPIVDAGVFTGGSQAVQLMTAHRAKGLEFETVFIINCLDEVWAGRGRNKLLPFPQNLPIAPAGDNFDDQLRLFFVALTRAKKQLCLTSHETGNNGKETRRLRFLDIPQSSPRLNLGELVDDVLVDTWDAYHSPPFCQDEKALLGPLVEDYRMSATHLNNFLDIRKGGPQYFLENNLLRFPQAKIPAGAYGSAVHNVIQLVYLYLKKSGRRPSLKQVLNWFEDKLSEQRLSREHQEYFLKKGQSELTAFYAAKKSGFSASHKIEFDFRNQNVVVGNAKLTGKIDKIIQEGDRIRVFDFKTGKAFDKWSNSELKLVFSRRQLVFYKLLIENSYMFGGKVVDKGVLEFVEPLNGRIVDLVLDISDEEAERLKRLVEAVYGKIKKLELPDVGGYARNAKGTRQFEEDLLSAKI